MDKKTLKIFVTRRLPEGVEARMRQLFDVTFNDEDKVLSREALKEVFLRYDIVVPTLNDVIDETLIKNAGPQLKMIANFGTGTDHIDVAAAYKRGIIVSSTPGVSTDDTADMTMALILAVPRRLAEGTALMQSDTVWAGWSPTWMLGRRITGKKLGIIGMGRIGQAVAKRAQAFGLSIHYHARRRIASAIEKQLDATFWENLDQMLAHSDIISVNCPSTPATFHLLSKRRLELLSSDAYVVNTSRGDIIDEGALLECLENNQIAGAALDVYGYLPNIEGRLKNLARKGKAVLLPHMGSATLECRVAMGEKVIINVQTFLDGHRPPDQVLSPHFDHSGKGTQAVR